MRDKWNVVVAQEVLDNIRVVRRGVVLQQSPVVNVASQHP